MDIKMQLSFYDERTDKNYRVKINNNFYDDTTEKYTNRLKDKRLVKLINDIENVVISYASLTYDTEG